MSEIKPLNGIRVLEMGQLIAGPFAGQMLGYFGAEVIKIESPGRGDPLRAWRMLDSSGTSFWWRSIARNKKSITLDLNQQAGRDIARSLMLQSDVLIENFRPGKMESWDLGPQQLKTDHPNLVYTRVSGYGQTGPYKDKPGFASACEAMGGFRHLNGFADRPPVRPNLSMGDTLAGMHAVIGTLLALFHREHNAKGGTGAGQVVDVSILESVFGLLESVVPEYSATGAIRQPSGSTLTGIVPTNTYQCQDGKYIVIGGNGDSIFRRLMVAVGRVDLAEDARLVDNPGRVQHESEIDGVLSHWAAGVTSTGALNILEQAEVPCAPIYAVDDMYKDEHFKARGMFESTEFDGSKVDVPAMHPRLSDTPGKTHWPGPSLGQHTDQVLHSLLGMNAAAIAALRANGTI